MIKKITVTNIFGNSFSASSEQFPNEQFSDLEHWKQHQIEVRAWGKPDRWEREDSNGRVEEGFTNTREVPLHEGSDEMVIEYFYPCQYQVTEEDITSKANKTLSLEARKEERMAMLDIIDYIADINLGSADNEQMDTIYSNPAYVAIILALLTGGTDTVRRKIAAVGPFLYPQNQVDEILAMVDAVLAKRNQ